MTTQAGRHRTGGGNRNLWSCAGAAALTLALLLTSRPASAQEARPDPPNPDLDAAAALAAAAQDADGRAADAADAAGGSAADASDGTAPRRGGWRLADSHSPYLRQHADNAVAWHPWGEAAFAEARRRDVPVLLSVGYSTCHWCHVMERESFEDEAIADFMAEHYVAIKVDREERPDIDDRYMAYVLATTGRGGWPMTVWMTPEGKPFFGGTYFPPEDRHGLAGFPRMLEGLAAAWRDDRPGVLAAADRAHDVITADVLPEPGEWDRAEVLAEAAAHFAAGLDPVDGGWRGTANAPKFPPSAELTLLLRRHAQRGEPLADGVTVSLDAMASRGLRDHVGGGFHRYCVDGRWQVPHFEKMLYDNAQLAALYAEAAAITGEARFERVARDTLHWVLSDMVSPEGLFWSARDADSRPFVSEALTGGVAGVALPRGDDVAHAGGTPAAGEHGAPEPEHPEPPHPEEGLFYLWTPGELEVVLGEEDGERFAWLYDITPRGNFEGGRSIPRPGLTVEAMAAAEVEAGRAEDAAVFVAWLDDARARLAAARAQRPPAFRDEKCLAAWNGLMLSGLADAARHLDDDTLRARTARAAADLVDGFDLAAVAAGDAPLAHQVFEGRASGSGDLSDHAFLARGLLDAARATGDDALAELSFDLTRQLLRRFEDPEDGGFFTTLGDDPLLPGRSRELNDGAVPAGTSITIELLRRLAPRDDSGRLAAAAERALSRLGPLLSQRARAWPSLLLAVQHPLPDDAGG